MNTYLAIITTALVVTQIIRLLQNAVQLHRQHVLFKKQLGQIEDVTQEDLDVQRKAYRLMVEYFESKKIKPPIVREETANVINIHAEAELDDLHTDKLEKVLKDKLAEELWRYAKVQRTAEPSNYCVRGQAVVSVLDKVVREDGKVD